MSEQGYYSERHQPMVELRLLKHNQQILTVEALVDTGFDGSVLAYKNIAALAGWPQTKRTRTVSLANGDRVGAHVTEASVNWLGEIQKRDVLVLPLQSQHREYCAIGMELLRGTRLLLGKSRMEIAQE